jgi:Leucine-rich repeat (LRR) protein
MSQLSALKLIDVSNNEIVTMEEIDLQSLAELNLAKNSLVSLPGNIGVLRSLGRLTLSNNQVLPIPVHFRAPCNKSCVTAFFFTGKSRRPAKPKTTVCGFKQAK